MTVYTFSEARQKFAALLERARREGAVRVKRRDGQVFLIQPERSRRSPLDVAGIDSDVSGEEIVEMVREMRQRVNILQPGKNSSQAVGKRVPKKGR
ncbi:type II toxin-antitoxin system Phd/YefM family antitoxin [Candidatus Binatus sp.]|uniref:type II toxin-antitoxin system Phd/YefM family antitoxin n=1 Tax=Candidatus Binatus sp. TaxID=2811406 RepID=UPI003CAB0331